MTDDGLEVMKRNGTGKRLLVSDHTAYLSQFSWSANGRSLLYIRDVVKQRCRTCPGIETYQLLAVNSVGKPKRHVLVKQIAHRIDEDHPR